MLRVAMRTWKNLLLVAEENGINNFVCKRLLTTRSFKYGKSRRVKADKKLFTPGPLGCSRTVKEAMLRDVGSRDQEFIDTIKYIRRKLLDVAGVSPNLFTAVPLQGSGTYAVEAVLSTTASRKEGKILILANGAYGRRMKQICDVAGISSDILNFSEIEPVHLPSVKEHLEKTCLYDTVAIVHCETTTGLLNPVEEVGKLVKQYIPNVNYFVDAMSSFGAIPLDVAESRVDFLVSSANKCLEGVPGFSYAVARTERLLACKGNCHSLSLDLVDQYEGLEKGGQFRFTPPTHVILAFRQALEEYEQSGGLPGRAGRYLENNAIIREGMRALGFQELLDKSLLQGNIITSYRYPSHTKFDFKEFYERLSDLGQVIYPGKVTNADCFRIGNIGQLFPEDMEILLKSIKCVCHDMGIPLPLQ